MLNYHRERFRNLNSKSFTVVIQHLSTRLIKPNFCFDLPHRRNLVPRVFHLPTPKGAREERPWLRLITCLGNKFIFKGGVLNYQSIVTAAVCHLLNRLSGQPWKALFRFRSEDLSYQVHCFQHLKLNWVWKLRKHKNVKLKRVILFDTRCLLHTTCSVAVLLN